MNADDLRFLLRRPITFHRALADVAGSAAGGLFLSQLLYWSDKGHDPDGWIYKTIEEWREETALTRTEQEAARRVLAARGILAVERRGLPARLYFRLDLDALARELASLQESTNLIAGKPQTSLPDPADQSAESGKPLYTETTAETTQEMLHSLAHIDRVMRAPRVGRR